MNLHELPEDQLLSYLLWGEARGEPLEAMVAVGCVVRNRVIRPGWWGRSWKEVMLMKAQFSCFNEGDPNRMKINEMAYHGFVPLREYKVARALIDGAIPDITDGATHYHDISVSPYWANKLTKIKQIGRFIFYK